MNSHLRVIKRKKRIPSVDGELTGVWSEEGRDDDGIEELMYLKKNVRDLFQFLKVTIRPMMYIALTYDHRLVDGREAVTFLR